MEYEPKKAFLINVAFIATLLIICYFVSEFMIGFLLPFIIAILLSFLSNKAAVKFGEKIKLKQKTLRTGFLLIFYLSLVCAVLLFIFILIKYSPSFLEELKNYISSPDNIFYAVSKKITQYALYLPKNLRAALTDTFDNFSKDIISAITDLISRLTMSFAKILPLFFINAAVTVVASFYITKDYPNLINFLKLMIGKKRYGTLTEIKNILLGSVLKFFLGYLILSGITFIVVLIAFLAFSVNHAVIFAFLIALIDLLPVLGSGTILIPAAIFNLINGNTKLFILLLILYIAVSLIRNFLEPKIISNQLDINPLLILITLFIGLRIGGLSGMLLLPVTVVAIITYYKRQLKKERLS